MTELERLIAAVDAAAKLGDRATPRPWFGDGGADHRHGGRVGFDASTGASIEPEVVAGGNRDDQGGAVGVLSNNDAEYIVAAANLDLPSIAAALRRAKAAEELAQAATLVIETGGIDELENLDLCLAAYNQAKGCK